MPKKILELSSPWRAERMVAARQAKGWTQTQLAQHIGLPQSTIGGLESGRRPPSLALAVLIADALEVSLDWLCGRTTHSTCSFPADDRLPHEP